MIKQRQRDELEDFLLVPERQNRNILKFCEEMAELSEVLLKWVNKEDKNKPPISKIIEEMGDVAFRGDIVMQQFDIEEEVFDRHSEKEEQVYNYYLEKTKEKA
jgi:hypothetical protein